MDHQATIALLRDALQAALQAHAKSGRARPCDCSLCEQIRHALKESGTSFAKQLREECARVADFVAHQAQREAERTQPTPELKGQVRTAKEIASRIRQLQV